METIYKKCLYCDDMTSEPHFQSRCCGRGMCDTCYRSDTGTMEQFQIDGMDEEDYEKYVEGIKYDYEGDYICFDHVKTNKQNPSGMCACGCHDIIIRPNGCKDCELNHK